jgi:hypothetical protein
VAPALPPAPLPLAPAAGGPLPPAAPAIPPAALGPPLLLGLAPLVPKASAFEALPALDSG